MNDSKPRGERGQIAAGVAARYRDGADPGEIMREYGISKSTLYGHLRRLGVELRRTPGAPTDRSRYAKGDRDDAARAAHTRDGQERRAAAREAAGTEWPEQDDKWVLKRSVALSARLEAVIDALRGDLPLGAWIREAVLEKAARDAGITVEELDTVKRPVQRRRNYRERQQDGKT